ncbi:hypothetical protein EJ04DRAFT_515795 [Polyplosphaeria fusca]|uniref:F-box domain-containing protein n=1 Tax=Polyplosphaeria fusca TaxID=682080 RepID=A0A9P4QRG5_9PLEO|nr:hypothetical protein EJ04DRAFT_515795 [Polyplosphaeria fusca]
MHSAWLIDDIWHLLLEHLTKSDLAVLAQTCHSFYKLAIPEIWHTTTSFEPLLRLLPDDYRQRALRIQDLERLDFYSAHIRLLHIEGSDVGQPLHLPAHLRKNKSQEPKNKWKKKKAESEGKNWGQVWEEVSSLRSNAFFLPNLQKLRISAADERYFIPITGILGKNLEHIYIKYMHYQQTPSLVRGFFESLQDISKLEYLFVRDGQDLVPNGLITNAPLKHVRFDPHIKEIPLLPGVLHKDTLEHLTIGLTNVWCTAALKISKQRYLPNLKTLWLTLSTFSPTKCAYYEGVAPDCVCGLQPMVDGSANKALTALQVSRMSKSAHEDQTKGDTSPCETNSGTSLGAMAALDLADPDPASRTIDCGRRSPATFFHALDHPQLELLNLKFQHDATGPELLNVVNAAKKSCRLTNLKELALSGSSWVGNDPEFLQRPAPKIRPEELREAFMMLLPLPHLKLLRLSAAPNFLDVFDLDLYSTITSQIPSVETLYLGNREFMASSTMMNNTIFYERVPMKNLAAFCSMLPNLKEVSVGYIDGLTLESEPQARFACPHVKNLTAWWAGKDWGYGINRNDLLNNIRMYFPFSDMVDREFLETSYLFEQR